MYQRLFDDCDPVAEPRTATGTPGDWWIVFTTSPAVLKHAGRGFGLYASPDRKVPGELRELGQTRPGWLVGSQFVFSQHCKVWRGYGFAEGKSKRSRRGPCRTCSRRSSGRLLANTDALVLGFGRVDDAVFDAMEEHLDDEAIMEFTYITMLYTMACVISRALRPSTTTVTTRCRDRRLGRLPAGQPRPQDRLRHGPSGEGRLNHRVRATARAPVDAIARTRRGLRRATTRSTHPGARVRSCNRARPTAASAQTRPRTAIAEPRAFAFVQHGAAGRQPVRERGRAGGLGGGGSMLSGRPRPGRGRVVDNRDPKARQPMRTA